MSFRVFLLSLFVSRLGDQILLFVVPLVVFQLTGSVAWSGLAFAAENLPRYVSFPICGALCDRRSPLALLQVSQVLRAVACLLGVAGGAWMGGDVYWLIALSAVCGVLTTQGLMAREVMLPQIAAQGQRFDAVLASSQAADQVGFVLGPLLAAALLSAWHWQGAVAVAAALFVVADGATVLWRRMAQLALREPEGGAGSLLAPIRIAFGHVWRLPGLWQLVAMAAGVNLVIGVTLASSAAIVTGLYQRSPGWYAGLQMAGAIATVLVLLAIARHAFALRKLGLVSYALIFVGGALTAVAPSPWLYAAGFVLVIGFDKMFNVFIRAGRQKIIPLGDYGKTTGVVVMLNNLTQPLAGLLVGAAAGLQQTGWTILALSLAMGLLGITIGRRAFQKAVHHPAP